MTVDVGDMRAKYGGMIMFHMNASTDRGAERLGQLCEPAAAESWWRMNRASKTSIQGTNQ